MKSALHKLKKIPTGLLFGLVLVLFGIGLAAGSRLLQRPTTSTAAFAATPVIRQSISAPAPISGEPTRIAIPSVGIELPVIRGYYDAPTKTWSFGSNTAQYATVTAPAN